MSRDENVIRAYRDGGAEVRMDTYLAYPGLRVLFDEIEREEGRGSPPGDGGKWKDPVLCDPVGRVVTVERTAGKVMAVMEF